MKTSPASSRNDRSSIGGFTLIELLMAISITAIVGIMAYGGLDAAMNANEVAQRQADRIQEINLAMTILARDIRQSQARPIRDESGDPETAFWGNGSGEDALTLTRSGWQNPTGRNRSKLQRVRYHHRDNRLIRESWSVLDRGWDADSYDSTLLSDVEDLSMRFLRPITEEDAPVDSEWVDDWTPTGLPLLENAYLPLALEITMVLGDWGPIRRVYVVAPYWPLETDFQRLGGSEDVLQ